MGSGATIAYFVVRAVVFLTLGVGEVGFRRPDLDDLFFFVLNYLFFAAPQILWAILSRILRTASPMSHAGYLGPTVVSRVARVVCVLREQFECSRLVTILAFGGGGYDPGVC